MIGRSDSAAEYWRDVAVYWRDVYDADTVDGEIYRARHHRALAWVADLALPGGLAVLDVGCGAGLLSADLSGAGYHVVAVDSSRAMVGLTCRHADMLGLAGEVAACVGDVHALGLKSGSFALVVALGVVPWLTSPGAALRELVRLTRPGGHVLLSSDNSVGLAHLLDPQSTPLLRPVRREVRRTLVRLGRYPWDHPGPREHRYAPGTVDALLAAAGLVPTRKATLGFGQFSLFARPLFAARRGIALHSRLQRLADRQRPVIHSLGNHYLVLAIKPAEQDEP